MSVNQAGLAAVVQLKKTIVAITSTTSEAAITGAGLKNLKAGMGILIVNALDIASGDEVYTAVIEGSNDGGSTWTARGAFPVLRAVDTAVVGTYVCNVDRIAPQMRLTMTMAGTTPSMIYLCVLVAMDVSPVYQPHGGTAGNIILA